MENINYTGEEWRDVPGYSGFYQVSNFGRVRSVDRMIKNCGKTGKYHLYKGKILKPKTKNNGYLFVDFSCEGKITYHHVHRLVAEAFIPNPDNLPHVNHKSEVKTENFVENLEWCTNQYNQNYGTKIQRQIESAINNGHYYKPEEREEKSKQRRAEYYNTKVKGNPLYRERQKLYMRKYRASLSDEKKAEIRAKQRKHYYDTRKHNEGACN